MGYKIMNKRAKVENYTGLAKSNPCQGILLELSNITRDNATNGSFCLKQPQKKHKGFYISKTIQNSFVMKR